MDFDLDAFLKERKEALLSMDEETIRGFFRKYNGREMPGNTATFWMAVHKARTADRTLPMFERAASKRWLIIHNSEPMDDGDVLPPTDKANAKKYFARLERWGIE